MPIHPRACHVCRTLNGGCRQSVIGRSDPLCVASHPLPRREPVNPDLFGLDLLIPAPRRSPENIRTH